MSILTAVIIVTVIGAVGGIGLCVCSHFMDVPSDEKAEKILAVLPGANCGGCGYSGCEAYAAALSSGKASPGACAPGGAAAAAKIAEILGVDAADAKQMVAFVKCDGTNDRNKKQINYNGIMTCTAANMYYGGEGTCKYGCLGYGDCAAVCKFDSIKIENGKATVDREKCVGCGSCVKVCPKRVIKLIPKDAKTAVKCANKEKALLAKPVCTSSCIGCGICAKKCQSGAIVIDENLAKFNFDKCVGCGECAAACPRKAIITLS